MSKTKCKKIKIQGMTCVACETILSDEIKDIKGVTTVTVCRKKSEAEIHYTNDFDEDLVAKKIKHLGYTIGDKKPKSKVTATQWVLSIIIVIGLYFAYKLFSALGMFDWLQVDPENISYGVAFLIGIVASLSTCLAVVGAVIISFSAKYESKGNFFQSNVKPQIMFHAGRWASFFILGGILGILGSWIDFSSGFMGAFTLVIALVLVWLGLNILGFVPSVTNLGVRMPKKFTQYWSKLKESEHRAAPALLGAFTFFLPCGFTQSMQLFAVSSGSFWEGGLTLLLFAIGTTPVLFSVGTAASKFSHSKSVVFKKVVGFIVVMFALYTMSSGLALAGINTSFLDSGEKGDVVLKGAVQEIVMDVNYRGFTPNTFTIQKGVPVKWIINGEQITGCTNEIISKQLGIRKKIVPGPNIVEFTPQQAGTIGFSCWMGMVRGKFIVTDEGGNVPLTANTSASEEVSFEGAICDGGGECGGTCGSTSCGCGG
jgi:uncharacterized protein